MNDRIRALLLRVEETGRPLVDRPASRQDAQLMVFLDAVATLGIALAEEPETEADDGPFAIFYGVPDRWAA